MKQKVKAEELRVAIRDVASAKRSQLKQRKPKPFADSAISISGTNTVDVDNIIPDTSQLTIDNTQAKRPSHHYVEIREMFDEYSSDEFAAPQVLAHDPREELLAHYVDVVFPIQFPLSQDSKTARVWLLPLIMQVKPLYHAAISIAAYHKGLTGQSIGNQNYWNVHHGLALKELRQYLGECHGYNLAVSLESNIEVLGTIILLVSLEVSLAISMVKLEPKLTKRGNDGRY